MGIPSLFRTLVNNYSDIHYWRNENIDQLYLDYNCLIHHCKANLKITKSMTLRDIEEDLITDIINYTTHIITEVIKPRKLVYIAIDGPVPMGKLVKQRARRYKKIQDDGYVKKMKQKFEIETTMEFDSNKITPGTPFMSKLCSRIKNFIMLGAFSSHIKVEERNKSYKVFFSDANISGEGEQKIMNFIRNGHKNHLKKTPATVIYGLDADLIVLSMALERTNIKLLREPTNLSDELELKYNECEFLYLDTDKISDALINEYKLSNYDRKKVLTDFLFFSFFGGNDFVEPFINTKMRDRGLDKLFVAYKKVLQTNQYLLNEDGFPNKEQFEIFLKCLAETEDVTCKKNNLKQDRYDKKPTAKSTKEEKLRYEMNKYEHTLYKNEMNPFHEYYNSCLNVIDYSKNYDEWKKEYNTYFFRGNQLTNVFKEYIKCLDWTYKYYVNGEPPSWKWVFKYRNSPLCSDLHEFINILSVSQYNKMWKSIKYENDEPLKPIEQLLAVLPRHNCGLLPFSFNMVFRDNDFILNDYPKKFKLDVVKGLKNIYSEPILPPINCETIKLLIENIPVSEPEIARNTIRERLFCVKF